MMQVARGRRERKADLAYAYGRLDVDPAHQNRLAVACTVGGTWGHGLLEIPHFLGQELPGPIPFVIEWVGMILPEELSLVNFIEPLRGEVIAALMAARVGGRIQLVHRPYHWWHKERSHSWLRIRAGLGQLIRETVRRAEIF